MNRKRVLDSYALLAYLKKEDKYKRIKELLASKDTILLMNEINLGECFYILARERTIDEAEYFIHNILPNLPIKRISNSFQDIIEAAKIKAEHPLSYADCFVIQTSLRENAPLITGDPEFRKADKLVQVEWL